MSIIISPGSVPRLPYRLMSDELEEGRCLSGRSLGVLAAHPQIYPKHDPKEFRCCPQAAASDGLDAPAFNRARSSRSQTLTDNRENFPSKRRSPVRKLTLLGELYKPIGAKWRSPLVFV